MTALRGQLRQLAHDALVAAGTLAGSNIFLPRDLPTAAATMPNVSIQTPRWSQDDQTNGNSGPRFLTVIWLELRCQVQGANPAQVEADLETLSDEAELAMMGLIAGPPQLFRRIAQGNHELSLSSEGARHFGEAVLRFGFETTERFEPVITDTLSGLDVTVVAGPALFAVAAVATAAGNAVLHFGAGNLPAGLAPGMVAVDRTTPDVIPENATVHAVNLSTGDVTLSANLIGAGVAIGDTIEFAGPILAEATFDTSS